uniref:Otoraplin n=1 Tax=Latimeria chalumnae TaxID=7897 RepID=H3AG80_LATCH|nr:PREDICTED: otoraplin [Latimeria chalumnae]|eukprot:XP_005996935.1 PREDICTED: otoraplin [Latimeria chalumnae]
MVRLVYSVVLLSVLGFASQVVNGIFMDKLSEKKLCADEECVYTISLVKAEEDFNAPDCRFINIKKGEMIYVYSKLMKKMGSGEYWAGSVYNDQLGTVGYFPSNIVDEQQVFKEANKEMNTTDIDFFCE